MLVRDLVNRDPSFYESYAVLKEKLFILNRSKFCERSVFFRQELEKAESASSDPNTRKRVIFENHEPDDFEDYLRFLSTGKLDLAADDDDRLFPLLRLYVLADELCDFTIANLIMNEIMRAADEFKHTPSEKEIWYVWKFIEKDGHPLRRLFVDYQIHEADDDNLLFGEPDDNLFEYLKDVALGYSIAKLKGKRGEFGRADDIFVVKCSSRPYCYYHQHDKKDKYHLSCEERGLSGGAGDDE